MTMQMQMQILLATRTNESMMLSSKLVLNVTTSMDGIARSGEMSSLSHARHEGRRFHAAVACVNLSPSSLSTLSWGSSVAVDEDAEDKASSWVRDGSRSRITKEDAEVTSAPVAKALAGRCAWPRSASAVVAP